MSLEEAIAARSATVCVIGLGYVGLPLVIAAASVGFPVIGLDKDSKLVSRLRRGESRNPDIDAHELSSLVERQRVRFSDDSCVLAGADVVVICVQTPLAEGEPDLSYVEEAAGDVAQYLHEGELVSLESTVYPGATRERVLHQLAQRGLALGRDFFLAYSPERIDPGVPGHDPCSVKKVVGGFSERCGALAESFYGSFTQTHRVGSPEVAEMSKILENVYRCVNIALVFELAKAADSLHINLWEAIEAAATKPFGFRRFDPGPGIGGHCIPIDPFYLSWLGKREGFRTDFIDCAERAIQEMPPWVVKRSLGLLHEEGIAIGEANVLVIGVAYKANVDDCRETPATPIMLGLSAHGVDVSYHDPLVPEFALGTSRLASQDLNSETLDRADLVLIVADHEQVDYQLLAGARCLVFDTRNVMARKGIASERIVRL